MSSPRTLLATASTARRRSFAAAAALVLGASLALTGCGNATTSAASQTTTASATTIASGTTSTTATSDATTTTATIADTTAAAEAFLATLSEEQREAVLYDYDDETKTTSWSNFPVTFVERAGLNLADLTEEQKSAALAVLQGLLNEEAYETVSNIMAGDAYLSEYSSSTDADVLGQYYIAFFGTPSATSAYEVQFGGHHLGINATLDGATSAITFAPTHLGVQPADFTDDSGTEVAPFEGIYTDAFAFYDSLTAEQQATLTSGEVVFCAPGDTCDYPSGSGLSGADLSDEQKQLLLALIANWAGMADEQTTTDALAKIEATLDQTTIAWSGETTYDMTTGDGINFSVSGPNVFLGFQAQNGSAGADVEGVSTSGWGHVHTIYRDPSNDYAGSVTQQAASGMGGGTGAGTGGGTGGGMPSGGPGDGGTPPSGAAPTS